MKDKLLKQAGHEYSPNQRFVFLLLLAPVFLFLLPYLIISLGVRLDHWLQWLPFPNKPVNLFLGLLSITLGLLFALWSIYSQFTLGSGTPVPLMATQKLVIQPPYTYCRNPMALGTFAAYLGAGLLFRSIGAMILALLFTGALLVYIKRVEEKEMEVRFGQEYLAYKQHTPFLIPRFRKRH